MTPFRAAMGVVDRLQGLPLPKEITLYAIAASSRPNLDGVIDPDDVVSECPVEVHFTLERDELRSKSNVNIPLIEGTWTRLYVQLRDESGALFGKGVAAMAGKASHWLTAAPDMLTIATRAA